LEFGEAGKPEIPEKNPQSKDENQQQAQPTYDTGLELNPGHIGGRRVLSPLHHLCSPIYFSIFRYRRTINGFKSLKSFQSFRETAATTTTLSKPNIIVSGWLLVTL